jgi:membrane-bound lytic murein transglycosylase D
MAIYLRLALALTMAMALAGCATPQVAEKSKSSSVKEVAAHPVLDECFSYPNLAVDTPEKKVAGQIQAFLAQSGMLSGKPGEPGHRSMPDISEPVANFLKTYTTSQKAALQGSLSLSGRYLPMMQKVFKEQGLPPALVYLALVESGFNAFALSPKEALGIWQFMEGTGRRYGLRIDAEVDERRDPEKSTRAAARYLKDLHRQFGCWYLAIAAYNAGEGRVAGAVQRHGASDFAALAAKGFLPKETCNFVPHWLAVALIAHNPQEFGFGRPTYLKPWGFARVKVPGGTDLGIFADSLGVELKALLDLNPELNLPATPATQKEYALRVPPQKTQEARKLAQSLGKVVDLVSLKTN